MAEIPRLTSVADALGVLLTGLEPMPAIRLGAREAIGLTAAEVVTAGQPVPPHAVAQRSGIAVAATGLVGASPHAPAIMAAPPHPVQAGEALPAGADAVLPQDAAMAAGPFTEITQAAYPGENATLAGADLADGTTIVRAGETVTPAVALALELAGIANIAVRCPRFNVLDPSEDGGSEDTPHRHWLRGAVKRIGGRVVGPDDAAEAILAFPDDPAALPPPQNPFWVRRIGLALRPGGGAEVIDSGLSNPAILFPPRFDGVAACFYALVLPLMAHLTARAIRHETRPLTRRITSQIGFTDVALLRCVEAGYEPLAVGQITLSALIAADAVALIPPESEGAAAGTPIDAIPMHDPLRPA